jgi:hypothetical protein
MIHSKDGSARTGSGKRIPAATLVPFICLLTLVLCCAPARKEPAPPVDPGDAVDGLFAHFADGDSPGVAVAVIRDGEIVHRAGYGLADLETGTPITPDTTFRLASVSKQLTAMAIMLLAEEGKLDYDDPVVQYLPELERFGSEITIRHLLQHTSGLPDYYDTLEAELEEDWITNQEAVEFFSQWGETLFGSGRVLFAVGRDPLPRRRALRVQQPRLRDAGRHRRAGEQGVVSRIHGREDLPAAGNEQHQSVRPDRA